MFGIKPRNVEGISLKDIPIFNPNQTETEDNSIFALGLDKYGKLVKRAQTGFGGAAPDWNATVDVGGSVTNLNSNINILKGLGSTSQLAFFGVLRNKTNISRRSYFRFDDSQMTLEYSNASNTTTGVSLVNSFASLYTADVSRNNISNLSLQLDSIELRTKNALGAYSSITQSALGELYATATNGFGNITQLRVTTAGVGIRSGISSVFAVFNSSGITTNRTIKIINTDGKLPIINMAAPATATSPGVEGQIGVLNGYAYFCVAPNTWRRVAIAAW